MARKRKAAAEQGPAEPGARIGAPDKVRVREEEHPAAPEGHRRMKAHVAAGSTLRVPHASGDVEMDVSEDGYIDAPEHVIPHILAHRLGTLAD